MEYELFGSRRRSGYWISVRRLIGHLCGTALIFTVLLVFAWGLSYLILGLNRVSPFPQEIYAIVTKVEVGVFYVDVVLSSFVLFAGGYRFVIEIMRESQ